MAELTHVAGDADLGPVGSSSRKGAAQPSLPSLSPARSSRASDSDTIHPAFRTDPEFEGLCPPLAAEERSLLEAEIAAHGVREPLVVWKEEQLLLDGHTRFGICTARGIDYDVVEYSFADRDAARNWVIDNAVSRRNLTPAQKTYLLGRKYVAERLPEGRPEKPGHDDPVSEPGLTAERIAKTAGVSGRTVKRAARFAADVDALAATAGAETKRAILDGSAKVTRRAVSKAAAAKPTSLAQFKKMVGEFPARRSSRADRDHIAEINALAKRLSVAMHSYATSGAQKKDRARLTELWELRTEIGRLHANLEGDE
ncbi:MAG: hypothetical protein K8T90_18570 [Planctomycetes bacterium]|nr:hypothetical protein [Planctomycetota bacterium]